MFHKELSKLLRQSRFKPIEWRMEGNCIRCTSHSLDACGYTQYHRGGWHRLCRAILARRFPLRKIPNGIVTRHTCDNRWCIRPDHLTSGTAGDNVRDARDRGRLNPPRGERCHLAKLDSSKVMKIIALYSTGMKQLEIALRFGISQSGVSRIINRNRWSHLC